MAIEGVADTVFSVITKRRSIRDYTDREVSDTTIREIIGAGIQAPNGLGFQPWRFVVVRNRDLMKQVSDYCKPILARSIEGVPGPQVEAFLKMLKNDEYNIFYNASVLILVLGAQDTTTSFLDCTLCAENMMLAAWSLGLGSCWIGSAMPVQQNPGLLAELQVPDGYQIVAPLIFGYPGFIPEKPGRRDPEIVWVR
jgi:nitroreductase